MGQVCSAIAFVNDFGEMPLFANQTFDGLVEDHGKPPLGAAHHASFDQKLVVEFKNRELQFNRLILGHAP